MAQLCFVGDACDKRQKMVSCSVSIAGNLPPFRIVSLLSLCFCLFTYNPLCPSVAVSPHAVAAELRRHKRSFLKLATKVTFSRLQDPAAAQRMFVDYIKQQLAAGE
jgi:hypothetical protein